MGSSVEESVRTVLVGHEHDLCHSPYNIRYEKSPVFLQQKGLAVGISALEIKEIGIEIARYDDERSQSDSRTKRSAITVCGYSHGTVNAPTALSGGVKGKAMAQYNEHCGERSCTCNLDKIGFFSLQTVRISAVFRD